MTERADVLVVGGGPAGATAAFQLAGAGVDVMLVDRAIFPREKTCGESLSPGALARLRAIGMWEPRTLDDMKPAAEAPTSMAVRGMRIRSPSGTTFLGRYRNNANGAGLVIRRRHFDHELLARARARGVRVLEGVEVLNGEATTTGDVAIRARTTGGGSPFQITAKKTVVADGRQSFLARQLGFIEKELSEPGRRRYAVRAHCDAVAGLSDLAEMHVGEGGYCGIAPLSRTTANLCYVVFSGRVDLSPRTMEADFCRHLERFPEIARRFQGSPVRGAVSVVGPLRLLSKKQHLGPFIACGDTTGFLDPFTGEGIAHAIASGVLAAQAVQLSLDGKGDAFAAYERDVQSLRRVKGAAALLLYSLVSRRTLANSAAFVFARLPRLGDAVVQLFGDQV